MCFQPRGAQAAEPEALDVSTHVVSFIQLTGRESTRLT